MRGLGTGEGGENSWPAAGGLEPGRGEWHLVGGDGGSGGGRFVEPLGQRLGGGRAVELFVELLLVGGALELLDELLEGEKREGSVGSANQYTKELGLICLNCSGPITPPCFHKSNMYRSKACPPPPLINRTPW